MTPNRVELKNSRVEALLQEVNSMKNKLRKEEQTIRDLNKLLTYYTGLTSTL